MSHVATALLPMDDDLLAAYHADQRAKGAGVAVQKQGLGFSALPGCATVFICSTLPARPPLPIIEATGDALPGL